MHHRGWKMNWTTASRHPVRKLFSLSWSAMVCSLVSHRTGFDALCVDVPAVHLATSKLGDAAKTDALNLATGKHVTNDALVHIC